MHIFDVNRTLRHTRFLETRRVQGERRKHRVLTRRAPPVCEAGARARPATTAVRAHDPKMNAPWGYLPETRGAPRTSQGRTGSVRSARAPESHRAHQAVPDQSRL